MNTFKRRKVVSVPAHDVPSHELDSLKQALEKSHATIELAPDGTILRANRNFLQVTKYEHEQLVGKHYEMLDANSAKPQERDELWSTLRAGSSVNLIWLMQSATGNEVWLRANYCPVMDDSRNVSRIIVFGDDISQSQREEADMKGKLSAIDRTRAIIEFDMSGTIQSANTNFLNTLNYTLDDIVGKHHSMFLSAQEVESSDYAAFWNTLQSGQYIKTRCRRLGKDGKEIWLQASYNPQKGASGRFEKVIKYATDITAERQAELELKSLTAEAIDVMGAMAKGDLTKRMNGQYSIETAVLAKSINDSVTQLANTIEKVSKSSEALKESSAQLTDLSTSSQSAAHQTADQTRAVASAAHNISQNVSLVVDGLQQLVSSVSQVSSSSHEAASVAEKAVNLAESAKLNVHQLAQSSSDIGAVIKVINSIADQTNLLALNATIEAARAGEAGKGFAVVANEVKELAKETARATEEVSVKISAIQSDSQVAVKAINDIGSTIENISATQSTIASSVKEQSTVSDSISHSVDDVAKGSNSIEGTISRATQLACENQVRADESQSTTAGISELADELNLLVGKFTI